MQHNQNKPDNEARLRAFLIAAKPRLEQLMNEARFESVRALVDKKIEQPALRGKQFDEYAEYTAIASLYEKINTFLKNIQSTSFATLHHELDETLESLAVKNKNYPSKNLIIELSKSATLAEKRVKPVSSTQIIGKLQQSEPQRKQLRTPAKLPKNKEPAPDLPARKAKVHLTDPEIVSLQKFLTHSIKSLDSYIESRRLKVGKIDPALLQRTDTSQAGYDARLTKEKYEVMRDLRDNLSKLSNQLNNQSDYINSIGEIQKHLDEAKSELTGALRKANYGMWSFSEGKSEKLVEDLKIDTKKLVEDYMKSEEVKQTQYRPGGYKPHDV